MNSRSKNLLAVAGIISAIFGIVGMIPFYLTEQYVVGIGATLLLVLGIVLLAIAFGD